MRFVTLSMAVLLWTLSAWRAPGAGDLTQPS